MHNIHPTIDSIELLVEQLQAEDTKHFLYRGQNDLFGSGDDFSRQIPSVFRVLENSNDKFELLIRSYLETAWLFNEVRQ